MFFVVKRTILLLATMSLLSLFAKAAPLGPLKPGDSAPQVTAPDQDGNPVVFGDVYAKGITLVYFYPKAATPGCTKEACSLRDSYAGLSGSGIQILGVSRDKPEAQKAFRDAQHLPFPLIADTDGKAAAAFHVPLIPVVGVPMRQSFLIKDGRIAWVSLNAQTSGAAQEVSKALESLK